MAPASLTSPKPSTFRSTEPTPHLPLSRDQPPVAGASRHPTQPARGSRSTHPHPHPVRPRAQRVAATTVSRSQPPLAGACRLPDTRPRIALNSSSPRAWGRARNARRRPRPLGVALSATGRSGVRERESDSTPPTVELLSRRRPRPLGVESPSLSARRADTRRVGEASGDRVRLDGLDSPVGFLGLGSRV